MTPHSAAPLSLTRFIGRQRELQEVRQVLARSRLVTITGVGGTGKTRLAAEVARLHAADPRTTTCWVELTPLSDARLLLEHVAACVHSQERTDRPLLDTLVESLRDSPCLLVLDNCEHLVEACAGLADQLLRLCPGLRILATSREALGVDGEHAWLLRGLSFGAASNEAAEFFADRASAVSVGFQADANPQAIERICQRLDGIPLAIELAASRVNVLTVGEIAHRLDDLFRLLPSANRMGSTRQRTLRATVEWSYRLISEDERTLLQRISVFAGAFSLEAVESICADAPLHAERVLDVLAGLVTRSLVSMHEQASGARYSAPEFIRQYAAELLDSDPAAASRQHRLHAGYFAGLAERARAHLERTHSPAWIAVLDLEYDNLRAAMVWAFANGEHALAHRLVGSLSWYWPQVWHLSELQTWMDQALRNPGREDSREWGLVLNGAGSFRYMRGDSHGARRLLEDAVTALNRSGDTLHEAVALATLANLLACAGDTTAAMARAERAAGIARALADSWPMAHVMSNGLAFVHARLGQLERAEQCLLEAAERMQGDDRHDWGVLELARARAVLAIDRQHFDAAREQALAALHAAQVTQRPHSILRVLVVAQRLFCALGAYSSAARLQSVLAAILAAGLKPFPEDARLQIESQALLAKAPPREPRDNSDTQSAESPLEALSWAARELASHSPAATTLAAIEAPAADDNDLRFRLLGRTEVMVSGTAVPADTWRQSKLLELLAFLLLHPQGRTRDQIGAALWPDASSVQVKNNFHVQLHKLRRCLGSSEAIVVSADQYRFNPAMRLWFDAAAFETGLSVALRAQGPALQERLEETLALYRGDLLDGIEVGEWCDVFRDELSARHLDALGALADAHLQAGGRAAAITALQEVTRRDPQREDASRRLMQCLADEGNVDAALAHYRRLAARLREEFAATPAAATTAIARRLAGGKAL